MFMWQLQVISYFNIYENTVFLSINMYHAAA